MHGRSTRNQNGHQDSPLQGLEAASSYYQWPNQRKVFAAPGVTYLPRFRYAQTVSAIDR